MEKIIHRFSLDVNKNGVQRTIQGIETGERYARELRITLRNGKENYEIPSDDSVKAVMYIRKPSSEIVSVNDCTIEGDEIVYLLGAEDVSVAGTIIMQLKVIGSLRGGAEAVLVSPRFNLEVWESETDDSGAESTDTFTALENALAQAQIAYSGRVTHVEIDEDYLITVTFNNGQTYESDALQQMSDKIKEIDESVEALDTKIDESVEALDTKIDESVEALDTKVDESVEALDTKIDGKADKVDPTTSGTFTHNGDAKMEDIDAHIIKATSLKYMESDGYHIVANEIKTLNDKDASLRNELTYVEGSVSKTTQELKEEIESASERAEDAYNLASRANREAANAINKANDNKVKIDLHTGLIGEGVGDKVPILGYLDGYYIAPNGSVTQYNATATLIKIDFLDFLFRGDNIIFNHVDLLPTENCLACAWYDISGNFISATDGLNIIAEIDEQTFKITKQYIDYCVIPVPAGAHSCKMSGLANGIADIRIQTSLSEAIKDLQSKPETVPLVLTNPSPLPATDSKPILGIDAKGKSWQNGTQNFTFTQGAIVPTVGSALNQDINANNSRCTSNIIQLPMGSVISAPSGYEIYLAHATTENGNIDIAQTWVTTYTTTVDGYWRVVCRNKNNTSANITPSECRVIANVSPTPTNPIEIIDASTEVVAIGKNLFDKERCVNGYLDGNGNVVSNPQYRVSDYIEVGHSQITISGNKGGNEVICFFAEDKTRVSFFAMGSNNIKTLDVPQNAKYVRCTVSADNLNVYQVEIGATATSYVPYQSNTITLPYTLKSVGNVADELIVNEDGSGKIVQRVYEYIPTADKCVDSAPIQSSKCGRMAFTLDHILSANVNIDAMSTHYSNMNTTTYADLNLGEMSIKQQVAYTSYVRLTFPLSATTKAEAMAYLSDCKIYYPLPTPIEIPLTASEVAIIRALQTYKGTTVIDSEMDVASVSYSGDVKGYVDSKTDYSYTDQIIGKWADGKDLHRIVVNTNTPSSSGGIVIPFLNGNNCDIKNMYGFINWTSDTKVPINYYSTSTNFATTYPSTNGIVMSMGNSLISKPCEIVVEYTLNEESGIALLSNEGEVVANE